MSLDATKLILGSGAAAAVIGLLIAAVCDPTSGDMRRLSRVADVVKRAPRLAVASQQAGRAQELAQRPIFVMTTGASAYTPKAIQLFGLAISPRRKAALISIDGGQSVWMAVGERNGDLQLVQIDARHAYFETPLGERVVGLNDPAPAPTTTPSGG